MARRQGHDTKKTECVHHWEIAIANGPMSEGKCKLCGKVQDFQNSIFSEHITLLTDRSKTLNEGDR